MFIQYYTSLSKKRNIWTKATYFPVRYRPAPQFTFEQTWQMPLRVVDAPVRNWSVGHTGCLMHVPVGPAPNSSITAKRPHI